LGEGIATVSERRRVEHDQVKLLAASLELAEAVKDIAGFKPATLAVTIACGILLRHLQYRGRAVHPQHCTSTSGSGMHTESARVTKRIQHGATRWYQGMQRQMVVHLIEVKARFVATCEIHLKSEAMLLYRHDGREGDIEEAVAQLQTIVATHTQIIAQIDLLQASQFAQQP